MLAADLPPALRGHRGTNCATGLVSHVEARCECVVTREHVAKPQQSAIVVTCILPTNYTFIEQRYVSVQAFLGDRHRRVLRSASAGSQTSPKRLPNRQYQPPPWGVSAASMSVRIACRMWLGRLGQAWPICSSSLSSRQETSAAVMAGRFSLQP